jgi:hypothetical protein
MQSMSVAWPALKQVHMCNRFVSAINGRQDEWGMQNRKESIFFQVHLNNTLYFQLPHRNDLLIFTQQNSVGYEFPNYAPGPS